MNDQDLSATLRLIHQERTRLPDPQELHARVRVIPATKRRGRRWLPIALDGTAQPLVNATRFVAAAAIVALFGGLLVVAQPFAQRGTTAPGAAVGASSQPSEVACDSLDTDLTSVGDARDLVPGCWYYTDGPGFQVPTSGWSYRPFARSGLVGVWSIAKGDSAIFVVGATPDGMFADPCEQVRGEPVSVQADGSDAILQHSADLVAAMTAIPGIEVIEAPSNIMGEPGAVSRDHVVIRVPEDACMPFSLWWDSDTGARLVTEPGAAIRVWIYNHIFIRRFGDPVRLWIEAETPAGADPELDDEIEQIVASIGLGS